MAEFPALTLWTDSYLADTRSLTTLEHGAYLLLLMEAWRRPHCDLPDDDVMLSRLAGVSEAEWAKIKPIVMGFWKRDGRSQTWKQKRLTKERDAARKRSRSQKDKAVKRWKGEKTKDAAASVKPSRDDASTATATAISDTSVSDSNARATHLPKSFQPNLTTPMVKSITDGWPPGMLERQISRFRDHAADKGRTSKDWQAAFRNWIKKADEYWKRDNDRHRHQPTDHDIAALDRRLKQTG